MTEMEFTSRIMKCAVRCLRTLGVFSVFCAYAADASAQVPNVTGQMAPPAPGVRHHYCGLQSGIPSETVPATGSVSVNLTVPSPTSRSINVPFSLIYNSSGVWQLSYAGSWSCSFPLLSSSTNAATGSERYKTRGAVRRDATTDRGGRSNGDVPGTAWLSTQDDFNAGALQSRACSRAERK